ncbi:MAG TPA: VTT domain-containing protein [Gemmatimonadaceae bacterium]|nr:VTT domain-containing protein [Gemmatimonadaceae bacterium]
MTTPADDRRTLPRRRVRRSIVHLIAVLHRWAESGWSGPAAGSWAVLQSSVMPGPADILLIPLGLADPPRVYRIAVWSIAGATIGGILAWTIGALAFDVVEPVLGWIGVGPAELARSRVLFEEHGWIVVLLGTIIPLSTKVICIAAGAFGVPFPHFALAVIVGRTIRYLVVATVVRYAGEWLVRRLEAKIGKPIERWE